MKKTLTMLFVLFSMIGFGQTRPTNSEFKSLITPRAATIWWDNTKKEMWVTSSYSGDQKFWTAKATQLRLDSLAIKKQNTLHITTTGTSGAATIVNDSTINIPQYVGGVSYTLPEATSTTLGGIKIGTGISIASGVASVSINYQAPIAAGTTAQYWRGDKTWQATTDFAPSSVYPATGLTTGYVPYKSTTVLANSPIWTDETRVGIGTTSPTAVLHLKAGTVTANTAPLKFTSGTNLTTPEAGAMEYNGTNLHFTPSGTTRKTIAYNPMTTGGDLIYGGASGVETRLANGTADQFLKSTGTTTAPVWGSPVTSVAALTLVTTGTDLSSTVANGTTTPVITLQVPTASATNRGVLSSADWSTFNAKQSALTNGTTLQYFRGDLSLATFPTVPTTTNQLTNNSGFITGFTETDPIFTAWNKSTGISITKSQVSDFGSYQAPISLTTTGTSGAATLTGATLNIPQYSGGILNTTGMTTNFVQKWDGTKFVDWINPRPQTIPVSTTAVWDVNQGIDANMTMTGDCYITLQNLKVSTSGTLHITKQLTDYRLQFKGYTLSISRNIDWDSTGILISGNSKEDSYTWTYNGEVVTINGNKDYNRTSF